MVGYVAAAAASGLPTDWERLAAEVGLTQELANAIRAGARRRYTAILCSKDVQLTFCLPRSPGHHAGVSHVQASQALSQCRSLLY